MRAGAVRTALGQDMQSSAARASRTTMKPILPKLSSRDHKSKRTGIRRGGLTLPYVFGLEVKVVPANCRPSASRRQLTP